MGWFMISPFIIGGFYYWQVNGISCLKLKYKICFG